MGYAASHRDAGRSKRPNTLKQVLKQYVMPIVSQGAGTELQEVDRHLTTFKPDLQQVLQRNQPVYYVCLTQTIILFIVEIALTLIHLPGSANGDAVKGIVSGVFGIGCGGLIKQMIALWREKTRIEMMIVFVDGEDSKSVQDMINKLADKL